MLHHIGRGIVFTNRTLTSRGLSTNKTKQAATANTVVNPNEDIGNEPINDPHIFGTLSQRGKHKLAVNQVERFHPEDKSGYDKEEYDIKPRKNAYYYKYEIAKYSKQGAPGLKKALELFREMKSEARLAPNYQHFSLLVNACARAGYTKRAFELYEEWLKYSVKPSNSGINGLLNACAECPFPEYGLKRLEWFLTEVKVRFDHDLNLIQYNTAIKAYGKQGRLDEASKMVQQMIDNGVEPDLNTFKSLLIGCASNKESGSSLGLRVFKRLKMYELKPDLVTYRLLLRCIRDCGLGSNELIRETINELPAMTTLEQRLEYRKKIPRNEKKFRQNFEWAPLLTDLGKSLAKAVSQPNCDDRDKIRGDIIQASETRTTSRQTKRPAGQKTTTCDKQQQQQEKDVRLTTRKKINTDECHHDQRSNDNTSLVGQNEDLKLPNVLSDDHLDLMFRIEGLQVDRLQDKYDRLVLFGGPQGFIEAMLNDGCKPDDRTFSLILSCLKPSKENFLALFKLSETLKVQRTVDFYDQLIWYITSEFHDKTRLEFALEFIEKMQLDRLRPTINTFEALACGCDNWKQAKQLMNDLNSAGLVVSNPMIESFFNSALARHQFFFLTMLLHLSRKMNFKPTTRCIERMEALRLYTNNLIAKQEKGRIPVILNDNLIEHFEEFSQELVDFLNRIELREEIHPWEQFNVPSESKKDEFFRFIRHLNAMDRVKRDTLKSGKGHLGNVAYKANKLLEQANLN